MPRPTNSLPHATGLPISATTMTSTMPARWRWAGVRSIRR
jgi:hypothetical protein